MEWEEQRIGAMNLAELKQKYLRPGTILAGIDETVISRACIKDSFLPPKNDSTVKKRVVIQKKSPARELKLYQDPDTASRNLISPKALRISET